MRDLLTSFALEDLDESISFALLLRLHESGALSDRHLREALRMVAGDVLEWLVALESIDLNQLGDAFSEVISGSIGEKIGRALTN